jgi:hypothetical protein
LGDDKPVEDVLAAGVNVSFWDREACIWPLGIPNTKEKKISRDTRGGWSGCIFE